MLPCHVQCPAASDADLLRVHDVEYLAHIKELCARPGGVTPRVHIDGDTVVSPLSDVAARAAAGAVMMAVDM